MPPLSHFIRERISFFFLFFFLSIITCTIYFLFYVDRAQVEIEIEVEKPTIVKIYWAGENDLYAEQKMAYVKVFPNKEKYSFFLTDLEKVTRLRIDPQQYEGKSSLKKLTISQKGLQTLRFISKDDFQRLVPLQQIESSTMENGGLQIVSTGRDPQFELSYQLVKDTFPWDETVLHLLAIFLAILLLCSGLAPLVEKALYVPLFLALALGLVLTMTTISKEKVHPDEYVHIAAAAYYQEHWLPPAVDDPEIRDTYSVYGASRLNSHEIYYLFAGKFQKVISSFGLSEHLSLRLFNVFLFCLLLIYGMRVAGGRPLLLSLLLSAQLWYVFSYCNSDAFALFISLLLGCQVVLPESFLNRLLWQREKKLVIVKTIGLGLLFGLLFLLKKNYYPYIVFLFLLLAWDLFSCQEKSVRRKAAKSLVGVVLLAMALVGLRLGADIFVNGMDRKEKMSVLQEELAAPVYKPSTPLEKKHPFLSKKARGTTFSQMIHADRWFGKTYYSGFGSYGYFIATGSYNYYQLIKFVGGAFLLFVVVSILAKGGLGGNFLCFSALSLSAALIAASFYHSWTADFQAQGRYLFPLLPMFGVLCAKYRKVLQPQLLSAFTFIMFILAVYSFLYVGLLNIEKIG